jgi:phosphatidylinositol glycan class V
MDRNTGFLRYWTLSNVPLFLLAAPMLAILTRSGIDILRLSLPGRRHDGGAKGKRRQAPPRALAGAARQGLGPPPPEHRLLVGAMAAVQVLLALLAFTSYHVQIITRISSGYPVWYWWVAGCLVDGRRAALGKGVVVFMAMYAMIQGVLFASFLPPA